MYGTGCFKCLLCVCRACEQCPSTCILRCTMAVGSEEEAYVTAFLHNSKHASVRPQCVRQQHRPIWEHSSHLLSLLPMKALFAQKITCVIYLLSKGKAVFIWVCLIPFYDAVSWHLHKLPVMLSSWWFFQSDTDNKKACFWYLDCFLWWSKCLFALVSLVIAGCWWHPCSGAVLHAVVGHQSWCSSRCSASTSTCLCENHLEISVEFSFRVCHLHLMSSLSWIVKLGFNC